MTVPATVDLKIVGGRVVTRPASARAWRSRARRQDRRHRRAAFMPEARQVIDARAVCAARPGRLGGSPGLLRPLRKDLAARAGPHRSV
jgi:hypothetical protein